MWLFFLQDVSEHITYWDPGGAHGRYSGALEFYFASKNSVAEELICSNLGKVVTLLADTSRKVCGVAAQEK